MSDPVPFIAGASSPVPMRPEEARAKEQEERRERDQPANLYSVAIEKGRRRIPDFVHFHAHDAAESRAHLVRLVSTGAFPRHSRIVAHGVTIGVLGDENGDSIIV